ncbi:MAG TPA: carboxypeptidase regulatory-like domain-containing protein, partial [Terriglobales bacterium]|nr:carboxypeptidase regulatory-like domain-containing protein [Terriglobales bacterium]
MPKKLVLSIALIALLFLLTGLGFAQASAESAVRGNLAGSVVDPSSALVQGAKVTLSGPMGERSTETDQEGRFLFQVLVPGSYSVKVEKQGFKSTDVKGVEVGTGRTSSISVKLEVGTSATTVEVTGGAITVDTESTALASNLTDNFYQSVPMGRGVTSLFYAAPGVTSGGGTGTANPSISGGTGLENNYIADGVSITDGAFGGIGVYSRIYGSLSSGINLSFVKEVQVKTGGFEAQYGKSTGGIVQIVTKTGSNAFHGSLGGFFAPQQLEATRLFSDDFGAGGSSQRFNLQGKVLHQSNYDVDAQVGGYV